MPTSIMPHNFRRFRALVFPPAASPIAARMSAWQYVGVLVGVSVVTGLLLLSFFIGIGITRSWPEAVVFFRDTFLTILVQLGTHYLLRYSDNPARRWLDRQPPVANGTLRHGLAVGLSLAVALGRFYFVGNSTENPARHGPVPLSAILIGTLIFSIIIGGLQAAVEAMERSRFLAAENELLKQEQLQARYEGLKQQLSPHFLFNSLSTLSGLIHDMPAAAGQFVEEMSGVYRYLLQHGEFSVVPLHEELAFMRSYVYLLQMRFGDNLQLRVDLPEEVQGRLLPPLALQLLVENAVKHNMLTRRQPLTISIEFRAPATLLVSNNRQPRLSPEPGSGTGLSNLTNRIRMLHHQDLLIQETPAAFAVYVPLPA